MVNNYYYYSESLMDNYIYSSFCFFAVGIYSILRGETRINEGERLFKDIIIPSDFSGMNGNAFNDYIIKLYRAMDYNCKNLPTSGDRGADIFAEKDGVCYVIQTKRWKNKVGSSTIQKIVGAKAWYNADKAICVTNSSFTKPARQWQNRGVELINGRRLDQMIIELQTKRDQ